MLCFIALRGVRAHENVEHSQRRENVIAVYRDRSRIVELLLQLEKKQQIIQNNVETQHNRMYSLYINSLCNVAFPMARFTCTCLWKSECDEAYSIELCLLYRKHLWIVFSFMVRFQVVWPWSMQRQYPIENDVLPWMYIDSEFEDFSFAKTHGLTT